MTEPEAIKLVTVLFAAFPAVNRGRSPDEIRASLNVYVRHLLDLDAATAGTVVDQLCRTLKFLPTIAEIREGCVRQQHGHRRAGADAWGDVLAAVQRYGYMREPGSDFQFDDPIVTFAVRQLGWRRICESSSQVADRSRFIELYDKIAADVRVDAQAAPGATSAALPMTQATLALGATMRGRLGEGS